MLLCGLELGPQSSTVVSHVLHKITKWLGLEGTLKIMLFQPLAVGRNTSHSAKLLITTSKWPRMVPGMGHPQLLLSLFQCVSSLTVKNFFLIAKPTLFHACYSIRSPTRNCGVKYSSCPGFSCTFPCLAILTSAGKWANLSAQP